MKNLLGILLLAVFLLMAGTNVFAEECELCGDINEDGQVDIADLVAFANCYGTAPPPPECDEYNWACANFNGDSGTTIEDLYIMIDYFFNGGPPLTCD